jgi:hypothetical protein
LISKSLGVSDRGKLLPGRLIDANAVKNLREFLPVFGLVNVPRVGAKNSCLASLLKAERNVLWMI